MNFFVESLYLISHISLQTKDFCLLKSMFYSFGSLSIIFVYVQYLDDYLLALPSSIVKIFHNIFLLSVFHVDRNRVHQPFQMLVQEFQFSVHFQLNFLTFLTLSHNVLQYSYNHVFLSK